METSKLLADAGFANGFAPRGDGLVTLGVDEPSLYMVRQVHGSGVVLASGPPASVRDQPADAVVVSGGAVGAVRVADCVPVLVGERSSGRAVAIHAGWRGVVSGVIPAALSAMRARPCDMVAAVGPCIRSCCFEVGEDVAEQILFAVPAAGVEVRRQGGKVWLDLVVAVRAQLEACGVTGSNIEVVGSCTRCAPAGYPSFRREGQACDRIVAAVRSTLAR
jgi:YfiH family protein